jgi:hypothetical protein
MSPLLSALRDAVSTVSGLEDFEILESIGAGFFAEVFKVRAIIIAPNEASYNFSKFTSYHSPWCLF